MEMEQLNETKRKELESLMKNFSEEIENFNRGKPITIVKFLRSTAIAYGRYRKIGNWEACRDCEEFIRSLSESSSKWLSYGIKIADKIDPEDPKTIPVL